MKSRALFSFLSLGMLLLQGCVSSFPVDPPSRKQWLRVIEVPPAIQTTHPESVEVNFLDMSAPMKEFVHTYAPMSSPARRRLERLFDAVKYHPSIQTEYDANATLTAEQVFNTGKGNCLAFSAMFIAMAREAGLAAYFQEVDVPPTWEQVTANTVAQYRHVNIGIQFPGGDRVVDFRMDRYKETYPRRRISDREATAHYYSNIGMENLVEGDLASAFIRMKLAIENAPDHPYFWTNMGIIQRRLGNPDLAEISYLRALYLDKYNYSAMSNLSILYDDQHKYELAKQLRELSDQSKLKNPYYRYALAQNAYRSGDYNDALQLLDYAVRRRSNEHKFYFLRGLSLQALGHSDEAINDVKKAIKLTDKEFEESTAERYQIQLQEWLSSRS